MLTVSIRSISRDLVGNVAHVEALILEDVGSHKRVVEHLFMIIPDLPESEFSAHILNTYQAESNADAA